MSGLHFSKHTIESSGRVDMTFFILHYFLQTEYYTNFLTMIVSPKENFNELARVGTRY